jgi:hypothetical protein
VDPLQEGELALAIEEPAACARSSVAPVVTHTSGMLLGM